MSPSALPTAPRNEEIQALLATLPKDLQDSWKNLSLLDELPLRAPEAFWRAREMAVQAKLMHSETRKRIEQVLSGTPEDLPGRFHQTADQIISEMVNYVGQRSDPAWYRLMSCSLDSFSEAAQQCAKLHLTPSLETQEAFLVPAKRKGGPWSASVAPGTVGMMWSMVSLKQLHVAQGYCVYSQDEYSYVEGGDRDPEIRRPRNGYNPQEKNIPVWGVARVVLKDGRKHIESRSISDADRARLAGNMRMPLDVAVQNAALRPALRAVIRQYLQDEPVLTAQARAEDELIRTSEKIDPSYRLLLDGALVTAAVERTGGYTVNDSTPAPKEVPAQVQQAAQETPAQKAARERLAQARSRVVQESLAPQAAPKAAPAASVSGAPATVTPPSLNQSASTPARDTTGRGIR